MSSFLLNRLSKRFPRLRHKVMEQVNQLLFPSHLPKLSPFGSVYDLLAFLAPEAKHIFEVGASNGRYTQVLRILFPEAKIVCFEANPAWKQSWPPAITEGTDPHIRLEWSAVGEQRGTLPFYANKEKDTSSLLAPKTGIDPEIDLYMVNDQVILVPVVNLDEFTAEHQISRIDILKMDIQGGELLALKGARRLLESRSVGVIYLEVSFVSMYERAPLFSDIDQYLNQIGYAFHGVYNLAYGENARVLYGDAIYTAPAQP